LEKQLALAPVLMPVYATMTSFRFVTRLEQRSGTATPTPQADSTRFIVCQGFSAGIHLGNIRQSNLLFFPVLGIC